MRIDRPAHVPWAMFVLLVAAGASLLYAAQWHPQRLPQTLRVFGELPPEHATIGGTPLGLVLGTIAFGIFLFAALLGAHKRIPFLRIGSVQAWLRAHIWLTLLTVPLILLHSGFRLGGPMTTLLMALYAIVMISGVYGLFLQHRLPTLMKEELPQEFVYEQIPYLRAQLCAAAERLLHSYRTAPIGIAVPEAENGSAAASEAALREFLERQLLPYLRARRGERRRLGNAREAEETFRYLKARVAAPYRPRVDEMESWSTERRLLDAQTRLQHWLHGWLLVHAPLSFLLLLVAGWHAFVTLFRF